MADPDVNSHGPPSGSHISVSEKDDSRILAEEELLGTGRQLTDTDRETSSFHSPHPNDLPSIFPRTDSPLGDDGICAENNALASEIEFSEESDSNVDAASHDNANAVAATQNSPTSSKRVQVEEHFFVEGKVQKYHNIEYGLQDHGTFEQQDVVPAPEQHTSVNPEHVVSAAHIPSFSTVLSANEEYCLTEMMRNLGSQRGNELLLAGEHKLVTKTKPVEEAEKINPPIVNHGDGIPLDFIKLVKQNRDKHDSPSILDEIDSIGGNEYDLNMSKELTAVENGQPGRGSDSFPALRGYTRRSGDSPVRGGREGGYVKSRKFYSGLGFESRLSFDVSENISPPPPPTDRKLAEALELARSMKFKPADGKSNRGRSAATHSSIFRSPGTTKATSVAAKSKVQSPPKKKTKRSKHTYFNKDTSDCLVVTTKFDDGCLSIDTLALAGTSIIRPSSVLAPGRQNSAINLGESFREPSVDEKRLIVQNAHNSAGLSCLSAQDYEDEHGPDNIYDAPAPPPPELISLSPIRSAASEAALLDLRELQDNDNLDWMSIPVLQPTLSSEDTTRNQSTVSVEAVHDGNDSSLLMDFGSPSRVAGQSSASPSYRRRGSISESTMPFSLMDQCLAMDEKLPGGRDVEETVANNVATATIVPNDGRIRYGRDELISMRHSIPPNLLVSIVDSIPIDFYSWSLRLRTKSRSSSVVPPKPPQPHVEVTTDAYVELPVKAKKISGLGASKWASLEQTSSTATEASPRPDQYKDNAASVAGVIFEASKVSSLDVLGESIIASKMATSPALDPQSKKSTGTRAGSGSTVNDIVQTRKLGGLADSKYASPKKSTEKPALNSFRGAGQSTSNRQSHPPRQSQAAGVSNDGNVEGGRPRVIDENVLPFPSRRRKRGRFGMDGGDGESPSLPRRRRSLPSSSSKSPLHSVNNVDDKVEGVAGNVFASPAMLSTTRAPLAPRANVHHYRVGAVQNPVVQYGQMSSTAAAAPYLPPPPLPVSAMPAAFVPNSSQPLFLQGHAFITGNRGEVRRVRCGVRGSPWHDKATNTVMAHIIVSDRIGCETEMVGALHGLPYDAQGNCWHADIFQAVEDLEKEEDAAPIGSPCIDPDLRYSSQPLTTVYSWQKGLEEPSLPRFVSGLNNNFGSPPIPIHPSVLPLSYPRSPRELSEAYIYPVHPSVPNKPAHFHPVADHPQPMRASREAFPRLANSMPGAALVTFPFQSGNRRYTFGSTLMPNFHSHPGYTAPQMQARGIPRQEPLDLYGAQPQQHNPPQKEVDHYFTKFQTPHVQTQRNPNQELFDHYVAQAQQPSAAQKSLQLLAQRIGPPVKFAPRRSNVADARSPNHPDGPPTPGIVIGNVPNSVSGSPDLVPEDAVSCQPSTLVDLADRSHFEDFDRVFCRLRGNAALPIVDPNATSASCLAIGGNLKGGKDEEDGTKNKSQDEDESKRECTREVVASLVALELE